MRPLRQLMFVFHGTLLAWITTVKRKGLILSQMMLESLPWSTKEPFPRASPWFWCFLSVWCRACELRVPVAAAEAVPSEASPWGERLTVPCTHRGTTAQPRSSSSILTAEAQPGISHDHFQPSEESEEPLMQNISVWDPRPRDHDSCSVLTPLPLCNHVCTGNNGPNFENQKKLS